MGQSYVGVGWIYWVQNNAVTSITVSWLRPRQSDPQLCLEQSIELSEILKRLQTQGIYYRVLEFTHRELTVCVEDTQTVVWLALAAEPTVLGARGV